jgi:hypothetical protein
MKTTRAIYLDFNNTPTSKAFINIPFAVKRLRVKNIVYLPAAAATAYQLLFCSISPNEPLGFVYQSDDLTVNTYSNIEIEFNNPIAISNEYIFQLKNLNGTIGSATGDDDCSIVMEFLSE